MLRILVLVIAALASFPAAAGKYTDAVSTCLADGTTGKERKALARWIFLAMSAHPEIVGLTNASADARDESDRATGQLLTRLITDTCKVEFQTAIRNEGNEAIGKSFEVLGQLAMQELMANPSVKTALLGIERYVDQNRLAATLQAR